MLLFMQFNSVLDKAECLGLVVVLNVGGLGEDSPLVGCHDFLLVHHRGWAIRLSHYIG